MEIEKAALCLIAIKKLAKEKNDNELLDSLEKVESMVNATFKDRFGI